MGYDSSSIASTLIHHIGTNILHTDQAKIMNIDWSENFPFVSLSVESLALVLFIFWYIKNKTTNKYIVYL